MNTRVDTRVDTARDDQQQQLVHFDGRPVFCVVPFHLVTVYSHSKHNPEKAYRRMVGRLRTWSCLFVRRVVRSGRLREYRVVRFQYFNQPYAQGNVTHPAAK